MCVQTTYRYKLTWNYIIPSKREFRVSNFDRSVKKNGNLTWFPAYRRRHARHTNTGIQNTRSDTKQRLRYHTVPYILLQVMWTRKSTARTLNNHQSSLASGINHHSIVNPSTRSINAPRKRPRGPWVLENHLEKKISHPEKWTMKYQVYF